MMDQKKIINEVLDFLKFKLNSDSCTPEDIKSIYEMCQKSIDSIGTVEDFSKFFGVPEQSIRTLINRRVIAKPKRRVYYRFMDILKNVPHNWLNNNK